MAESKKPYDDDLDIESILKDEVSAPKTKVVEDKKPYDPNKVKEKRREKIKKAAILAARILLSLMVAAYLVTMFMDWFGFTGEASVKGLADITKSIESSKEGYAAEMSPLQLAGHTLKNRDVYKTIHVSDSEEKTSIFSWLGMAYTWLFYFVFALGVVSILILILLKDLKLVSIVKVSSLIGAVAMMLNYVALRITYFSVFAINAESLVRLENSVSKTVSMNKDGIAVGNSFLPYGFEVSKNFYAAIVILLLWIAFSSILTEINSRMDNTKDIEADISK